MRTTITLDDRLARRLKDEMRTRGTGFRQTLEDTLRRGLDVTAPNPASSRFNVRARPMGLRTGVDPSRLHDLDTDLEIDHFLSVSRKQKESE